MLLPHLLAPFQTFFNLSKVLWIPLFISTFISGIIMDSKQSLSMKKASSRVIESFFLWWWWWLKQSTDPRCQLFSPNAMKLIDYCALHSIHVFVFVFKAAE
jgi:hypothetical protein